MRRLLVFTYAGLFLTVTCALACPEVQMAPTVAAKQCEGEQHDCCQQHDDSPSCSSCVDTSFLAGERSTEGVYPAMPFILGGAVLVESGGWVHESSLPITNVPLFIRNRVLRI